ncbi:MAG: hypothetical protein IPO63_04755 [Bacteroidetes bacterium]|nr:hypothetical protein [Bacteroidota bacterium]
MEQGIFVDMINLSGIWNNSLYSSHLTQSTQNKEVLVVDQQAEWMIV